MIRFYFYSFLDLQTKCNTELKAIDYIQQKKQFSRFKFFIIINDFTFRFIKKLKTRNH